MSLKVRPTGDTANAECAVMVLVATALTAGLESSFRGAYTFHMESDRRRSINAPDQPSAEEAAAQLRNIDEVRDRSGRMHAPGALAVLGLWQAFILPVYAWTLLTVMAPFDNSLYVVMPMIITSMLVGGAVEQFSVRQRIGSAMTVLLFALVLVFFALCILQIIEQPYPRILDTLLAIVLGFALAVGPIRWWVAAEDRSVRWVRRPLSRSSRIVTVILGAIVGLLVVTAEWEHANVISLGVVVLFMVVAAMSLTDAGLRRTGYEWSLVHWLLFGIGAVVVCAVLLLSAFTDVLSPVLLATVGSAIGIAIAGSAFLPARGTQQ